MRSMLLLVIVVLMTASILSALSAHASSSPVTAEIFSLDFSNVTEALKHLDTETEVYDGGLSSGDVGVSVVNGYLVFYGNNTGATSSTGYDEPIAVIKGYNESNGFSSYARMPYNYTVSVSFMVPGDPGHGNFYLLPRYRDVANKYEIAIDFDYSNIVFNKVINNNWQNIAIVPIGTGLAKDTWYRLVVRVSWEYNTSTGSYNNHFHVELYQGTSLLKSTDFYDSSIDPGQYNGLALLGFHISQAFTVYADNLSIEANMTQLGVEPDESSISGWGGTDLDATGLQGYNDTTALFIRIPLAASIEPGTDTKYWAVELDLDKDSRLGSWDYEYSIIARVGSDGSARADIYDSNGNWLGELHILGGGIGYNYLVVEVNESMLTGLGSSLYLAGYTQLGTTVDDHYPLDDTGGNQAADYYIWYLSPPELPSQWSVVSDAAGDAAPGAPSYLDILSVSTASSSTSTYFNISVNGDTPWYGGAAADYRVYIDADNDPSTGYSIGGIGADYVVEYKAGYVPALYRFNGTGFELVAREDYLFNPGGGPLVSIVIPLGDFTDPPLGSEISILGLTLQNNSVVDETTQLAVPVPEQAAFIVLSVVIAALLALALSSRRTGR